ncbi:hypothetical protein [Nocardioides sp. L-11A]|uniref:hypothetical protein n=1 Tax=Nocardioides sp. L-11A TaxID=3043848 RepID=UPI00249CB6B6|nr:hypothetical protein QJ852_19525 [Nocardioides sp. L-11A]
MEFLARVPVAVPVLVTALLILGGCADGPEAPAIETQESTAPDDLTCPDQLPLGADPGGHGFGTDRPAASAPSLRAPDRAWVCRYLPLEAGPAAQGSGVTYRWQRDGAAQPVAADALDPLTMSLAGLRPAHDDLICTSDLGPRWLLVLRHRDDLTGVVVDDYGCRQVRLTGEPFDTAPGDAGPSDAPGVVGGVLDAPPELLAGIKAAWG